MPQPVGSRRNIMGSVGFRTASLEDLRAGSANPQSVRRIRRRLILALTSWSPGVWSAILQRAGDPEAKALEWEASSQRIAANRLLRPLESIAYLLSFILTGVAAQILLLWNGWQFLHKRHAPSISSPLCLQLPSFAWNWYRGSGQLSPTSKALLP